MNFTEMDFQILAKMYTICIFKTDEQITIKLLYDLSATKEYLYERITFLEKYHLISSRRDGRLKFIFLTDEGAIIGKLYNEMTYILTKIDSKIKF